MLTSWHFRVKVNDKSYFRRWKVGSLASVFQRQLFRRNELQKLFNVLRAAKHVVLGSSRSGDEDLDGRVA